MVVMGDVGSWCRGGGNDSGGQKAVGMVVPSLFGYFLMGLWLGLWLGFGWFVVGYLLGLWWVWCHGGCCVVVTRFFDSLFNGLLLDLWLVCGLVFAGIVVGLGSLWLLYRGGMVERVVSMWRCG